MHTMEEYKGIDFYCDIAIADVISLQKEYESESVLAFHHTHPHWPVHIVVVPKKHIESLLTLSEEDTPLLIELIEVIKQIAKKVETEHGSARVLTNLGRYQDSKHLHFHVCTGEEIV